jgi:hypothetical protein
MKFLCIILSFAILFAGCYTNTTVTKDTPNQDGELTLWLHDGSHIISESGQYNRLENGYKVVGKQSGKYSYPVAFTGIVKDEQIKEVVSRECDVGLTVVMVTFGIAIVVGIVIVAMSEPMPGDGFKKGS